MYDPVESRDVFISYSSADENIAKEIVEKLKSRGISTWMAPFDVGQETLTQIRYIML